MVPDLGGSQSRLTWQWCESVWEERKYYGERGVGRWNERKERYWGGVGGVVHARSSSFTWSPVPGQLGQLPGWQGLLAHNLYFLLVG